MKIDIRKIKSHEVQPVFELLLQLARHEKIEDRMALTPQKMHEALFGEKADWNGLVITNDENDIIGFTLFTYANINRTYNATPLLFIDDIFIKPEYRKIGIGEKLLAALAKQAHERGIERIELWCLKDNQVGQSFYHKVGAKKLDYLDVYLLETVDLV